MKKTVIVWLCFTVGLLLCSYPLISSVVEHHRQQQAITTYENAVKDAENPEQILSDAVEYNEMLAQTNGAIVGDLQETVLAEENYEKLLNVSDTGIMGTIEIPKIQVDLPIYHGTEDEVLVNGIGHLEGTDPSGWRGRNEMCVDWDTGGLPNSKLFTRLDELEKGDLIFSQYL